jgi:hypothetical protein
VGTGGCVGVGVAANVVAIIWISSTSDAKLFIALTTVALGVAARVVAII